MKVKERTKHEIELKMNNMHDFVRMEYLENCLRQPITFDVKRFVFTKLSELYEKRKMFKHAARNLESAAEISIKYREKIDFYLKAIETFLKAGTEYFPEADRLLGKALACANTSQKPQIKEIVRSIYLRQAQIYEKDNKPRNALKVYEKVLTIKQDDFSLIEVKKKILPLYERLGHIQEFFNLKKQLDSLPEQ